MHLHVHIANKDDVKQGAVVVIGIAALHQCGLCACVQMPEIHLLNQSQALLRRSLAKLERQKKQVAVELAMQSKSVRD